MGTKHTHTHTAISMQKLVSHQIIEMFDMVIVAMRRIENISG